MTEATNIIVNTKSDNIKNNNIIIKILNILTILKLTLIIFLYNNSSNAFASSNSCFKLKDIDYCKSIDINNIKNKFELYCIEYNTKDARKGNNNVSNGNSTISSEGRDCTILFSLEVKDIDFGERSILDGVDCSKSENKNNSECLIFCLNFPENKECQEVCKNNPNDITLQHCMIEKCKSNPTAEGCSVCEAINQDKGNANNTGEYNQEENRNATWPRSPENTMDVKGTCLSGYTESEEGLPRRNCIVTGTEEEGNKDISWSAITGGSCVKGCRIRGDVENMDILFGNTNDNGGSSSNNSISTANVSSWTLCSNDDCSTLNNNIVLNDKDNITLDSLYENDKLVGTCPSGYTYLSGSGNSLADSLLRPVVSCDGVNGRLRISGRCEKNCILDSSNIWYWNKNGVKQNTGTIINSGEEIELACASGYTLKGSTIATCNNGELKYSSQNAYCFKQIDAGQSGTLNFDNGYIKVEVYGAKGGDSLLVKNNNRVLTGGNGGYVYGKIMLNSNKVFYYSAGNAGTDGNTAAIAKGGSSAAGCQGGDGAIISNNIYCGGGGACSIVIENSSSGQVLLAAGGGSGASNYTGAQGGDLNGLFGVAVSGRAGVPGGTADCMVSFDNTILMAGASATISAKAGGSATNGSCGSGGGGGYNGGCGGGSGGKCGSGGGGANYVKPSYFSISGNTAGENNSGGYINFYFSNIDNI